MLSEWGIWQRMVKREVEQACGYGKSGTLALIENMKMVNGGKVLVADREWVLDESIQQVNRWVCTLELRDREILVYYFVDRYPVRALARLMKLSRRQVTRRLNSLVGVCNGVFGKG